MMQISGDLILQFRDFTKHISLDSDKLLLFGNSVKIKTDLLCRLLLSYHWDFFWNGKIQVIEE